VSPAHALALALSPAHDDPEGEGRGENARLDASGTDEGAEQAPRVRVVIADDSEPVRWLLRALISLEPDLDLVGEAASGLEAVELAERKEVDVLLVDLSMPEMDGLEAMERLRDSRPRLRVVVYTGHISAEVERKARTLGAADYITKGTPPEDVVARIRRAAAAP
jgi:DNA-binding NarL/FixJ family response regulator